MRSRPARLVLVAVAVIAAGAAAVFLIQSEQQISERRTRFLTFDLQARDAARVLAEVRAAQQAYVAAGQSVTVWMSKVASLIDEGTQAVDNLRASADSASARESLLQAGATIMEFGNVDRRARDYASSGQQLMAGDVVFAEGGETAAQAGQLIEAARVAESQAFDESETSRRRLQAYALGGAAAAGGIVIVILALVVPQRERGIAEVSPGTAPVTGGELMLRGDPLRKAETLGKGARHPVSELKAAARLCTELGRVSSPENLKKLLVRAAGALDASGLIIWIGSPAGADLRPVLAHGYSPQTLARMIPVPRSADNAAAAAYRTSALQIVLARPGASSGAVVAPLISPDGCIGALTAEINNRGETSEAVQALAEIFAAQLTSVLSASFSAPAANAGQEQIAI